MLDADTRTFILPRPPLQTVTTVEYLDSTATWQTLSSSLYDLQADRKPGRVTIRSGSLPSIHSTIPLTYRITYVCGYADTAALLMVAEPALVLLLKALIKDIDGGCAPGESKSGKMLLDIYRIQPISFAAA